MYLLNAGAVVLVANEATNHIGDWLEGILLRELNFRIKLNNGIRILTE